LLDCGNEARAVTGTGDSFVDQIDGQVSVRS